MEVKAFIYNSLLELAANSYLVIDSDNSCVVIDPSKNNDDIVNYIKKNNLNLKAVLLTHGHFDHIRGVNRIFKQFKAPVYIHKDDVTLLENAKDNCSDKFSRMPIVVDIPKESLCVVEDNAQLDLLESPIKVIHTPYHTMGSVCFYLKDNNILFSGDSLFKGSVGRYDLPTSNVSLMRASLDKILALPKETQVYPGHGETTSIQDAL